MRPPAPSTERPACPLPKLGTKFDAELFKRALSAGARSNGLKPDEGKISRFAEEIAALDSKKRQKLLEARYLKDPHFREVWVEGGGPVVSAKAEEAAARDMELAPRSNSKHRRALMEDGSKEDDPAASRPFQSACLELTNIVTRMREEFGMDLLSACLRGGELIPCCAVLTNTSFKPVPFDDILYSFRMAKCRLK